MEFDNTQIFIWNALRTSRNLKCALASLKFQNTFCCLIWAVYFNETARVCNGTVKTVFVFTFYFKHELG